MHPAEALRTLRARLRALLYRDAVADEIREETEFHLDARAREHERRGLAPDDARRAARARFGNPAVVRDRGYDIRGGGIMESVLQDVRYGIRLLFKQRGFSIVALATLALGIGATTALFGVVDAALVRPLPYSHPEQLVHISLVDPARPGRFMAGSIADIDLWRASASVFAAIGTFGSGTAIATDGPEAERLSVQMATVDYLPLFGIRPVVGRFFTDEDERLGAAPVVLLGHRYWERRYNGDSSVLGRVIRLSTGSATIVGVVPDTFSAATSIWRPLQVADAERGQRQYSVTGRLRDGVTIAQAQRAMDSLPVKVAAGAGHLPGVALTSLYDRAVSSYRTTIGVLAGAVGFVLLIACVNVASLQLARGATREAELAIRASLGAGRGRLVRQLLIENVILSLAGAALGTGLAWLMFDTLIANIPISLPSDVTPAIDLRVLVLTLAVAVAAGVLFGLAPTLKLSRVDPVRALGASTRSARSSLSRRAGGLLVSIEVASAVVLVAGGALMLRSFQKLNEVDLGFRADDIMTLEATPVDPSPATYAAYYPALLDRVRALPGVVAAGATTQLPLDGSYTFSSALTDGPGGDQRQPIGPTEVLPGYFQAMGLRVIAGRLPDDHDRASGARVMVLSNLAARQLFPGTSPLGHRVQYGNVWYDVLAVVNDVSSDPGSPFPDALPPQVYVPYSNSDAFAPSSVARGKPLIVVVRPAGNAVPLPAMLGDAARAIGPRVVVRRVRSGRDWWSVDIATPHQRMVLLTILGGLGLILALVGVFGVTSFAVARRTHEIGVRMAFGAAPGQVVRTMLRDAAMPIGAGIAAGTVGAFFLTRVIAAFLFQTTPRDPVAFAAATAALAAFGALAAWLPARRAARIDPVQAIRQDN